MRRLTRRQIAPAGVRGSGGGEHTERILDTDLNIVAQFQAEVRGVAEYYRLAFNRHRLGLLKYVMERSLTKTLARKYRIRVAQV